MRNGYKEIKVVRGYEHLENSCGLMYEHRYVAEVKLGRILKFSECVHHIDGNKLNNDKDNIIVFATQKDHTAWHNFIKRNNLQNKFYEKYLIKNLDGSYFCNFKIKEKINHCLECGKRILSDSIRCKSCSSKIRHKNRISNLYPDINTLIKEIKETSFVKVGKKYGVSDNAIRLHLIRNGIEPKTVRSFKDNRFCASSSIG